MGVGCLIRAHWLGGSVLFFFSASGCWYIFIISCWSSLPPQHIKFSSESLHTAIRHILSGNELQQDDIVNHLNASTDTHPPHPSYLKKTCCGPLLGLCARPVLLTLSLWNTPAMLSERRRGGFPFCACAGLTVPHYPVVSLTSLPVLIYTYPPSCSGSLQCHITSRERSHVFLSFEERLLRAENANRPSHWHFESSQDKTRGLVIRGNCLGSLVVLRERR